MNDRLLPLPAESDLPTLTILSDGSEVSREFHMIGVVVTHEANRIPTARLTFLDGDVAQEDFPLSNLDEFAPGREIEIMAGYHAEEETIFKGIVVRHGIKSKGQRASTLNLLCKDPAAKMTVARRSAYFFESKDSEILDEIVASYDLESDIEETGVTHKEMVQYQSTDWDFLVARAEANGKLVFVRDGNIGIRSPDPGQDPVITLIYGATILEIETELDAEHQLGAVTTSTWDYSTQEPVEVEGADPGFGEQGNLTSSDLSGVFGEEDYRLHHGGAIDEGELQALGDGLRIRGNLAKIRGRVRCQGFSGVRPGDVIELAGSGERFNGKAYVTAVRHEITIDNWLTDLQIGLSPKRMYEEDDFQPPAAVGMLTGIPGLQVGVVTRLEGDPDGEDRIQVRLPLVNPEEDGLWTRVCTLDAGDNRGTFFRPEIGDEVICGFLHGDPRHPVMLGMLNSSAKPAPLTASDDNHEKGYFSRSNIKLTLDDDAKVLHIEMTDGREVKLDDDEGEIVVQDGDGNVIKLNSDGILVESGSNLEIKASGDIKIEGTNIEIKASGEFKADGGSGAEVTSGATTTVKGSLVQIN